MQDEVEVMGEIAALTTVVECFEVMQRSDCFSPLELRIKGLKLHLTD